MARTIVDIKGLSGRPEFPWTEHQIRDLMRRRDYPMPHKKLGKKYYFDLERVWNWFDGLPGVDRV